MYLTISASPFPPSCSTPCYPHNTSPLWLHVSVYSCNTLSLISTPHMHMGVGTSRDMSFWAAIPQEKSDFLPKQPVTTNGSSAKSGAPGVHPWSMLEFLPVWSCMHLVQVTTTAVSPCVTAMSFQRALTVFLPLPQRCSLSLGKELAQMSPLLLSTQLFLAR